MCTDSGAAVETLVLSDWQMLGYDVKHLLPCAIGMHCSDGEQAGVIGKPGVHKVREDGKIFPGSFH